MQMSLILSFSPWLLAPFSFEHINSPTLPPSYSKLLKGRSWGELNQLEN
jgi:hypothetical protein